MSNERRFALFVALMFAWLLGFPYLLQMLGLAPPPPPPKIQPPAAAAVEKDEAAVADAGKAGATKPAEAVVKADGEAEGEGEGEAKPEDSKREIPLVDRDELVMGSLTDKAPDGYRYELQLNQKGAGVDSFTSSRFEADFEARKNPHLPLRLMSRDRDLTWPPSLALTLSPPDATPRVSPPDFRERMGELDADALSTEDLLDAQLWEVVRDDQGRAVRPISQPAGGDKPALEGQELVFRVTADNGVIVTKTFRVWKNSDGFEVELGFDSPDQERAFSYNLFGPHGIPIEGEWYTGTFRDVFFGTVNGGATEVVTYSSYEVAKTADRIINSTALPLRFAGVENQYFAILVAPVPPPTSQDDRRDRETRAVVLNRDVESLQKSDVGVRISSKPLVVGPNVSATHVYHVFAGPKTTEALAPYGAEALATYRHSWIPGAPWIARVLITPTLSFTYGITEMVGRAFGGERGNYGIAIIMLTLIVRSLMFPLSRKQALMAQRSQQLQPFLKELQTKYKDDKERLTRETFALYKKHGVNPVSGCLPALVQLPIFVGLWQALNVSVPLRQATFLWINDLAAPDMLFQLPFDIMFLGRWFNLLPIIVVVLMLVQTKLFSPPPTTPEAEMQQKTMKYMMIFMGVMFYKVPAGLSLYFITSSLWSICERLLLPKITHATPDADADAATEAVAEKAEAPPKNGGGRGKPGSTSTPAPSKPRGRIAQFWTKVLEEARKDPTYRKMLEEREGKEKGKGSSNGPDDRRDRGRPRARPGKR